jgi:hypothetical protein
MRQTLHIFTKDVRRIWPEILILLALITAFVEIHSYVWAVDTLRGIEGGNGTIGLLKTLFYILALLIPVGWWLLIARVIHEERLVGDTQFWITRPYRWPSLLAAKLLLIAVFVFPPLLLAQCILLKQEGFSPQNFVPELLFNLLKIAVLLVLPVIAIATVTSNLARMTLTLLGTLLCLGLAVIVWAFLTENKIASTVGESIAFLLVMMVCATAVVLQFVLRKTWLSRVLLIVFPILCCVFAFIAPDQMNSTYLQVPSGTAVPIQLAYRPNALHTSESAELVPTSGGNVGRKVYSIRVPIRVSGIEEGYGITSDAARVTIEAPDGSHWTSEWESISEKYLPGNPLVSADFTVPVSVYDKYKSLPVSVRLSLALTQMQASKEFSISLPAHEFIVPDFGICAWYSDVSIVSCRSALREPQLTRVSMRLMETTCSISQGGPNTGVSADNWVGSIDRSPAQFGIVPIKYKYLSAFSNIRNFREIGPVRNLCPGTPITFTQYNPIRRFQTGLTIQNFHFPTEISKVQGYPAS